MWQMFCILIQKHISFMLYGMFKCALLRSHLCAVTSIIIKQKNVCGYLPLNMSSQKRNNSNSISQKLVKSRRLNSETNPSVNIMSSVNKTNIIEVMESPDKSENDKKSYRVIRLANGLTALLVSSPATAKSVIDSSAHQKSIEASSLSSDDENDNESDESGEESDDDENGSDGTKLAACSLCVDVGSFSDPRNIQGLAHFLEHMIFMGSEKYPSENEFDQYMQKAGGFDNADTDYEETSFYFESREEFLDGALDRFSHLFKAPLMLKEAMTREREAVESEFTSKKNAEDVRREQLIASIGQPTHPASIFAWGNLKTLKDDIADDDLYEKVHEFRKRHYSAHRMYVCLQSVLPLDDLQNLVDKHFSSIPTNQLPGDDFAQFSNLNAFQTKFYEKVYFIKPIANITKIDISWCLEPMIQNFKGKPNHYIGFILGHEGKGSLLSYLRKKLWAVDLAAGTDDSSLGDNSLFSLFGITIHLTDDGLDHLDEVLEAVFAYLRFLQISGPNQSLFEEIQNIEANAFRFANERDPLDNVEELVLCLKQYPSKYILTGDSLYFNYDPKGIQRIIDVLNTRKFNIMITSTRKYDENIKYDMVEPWLGTEYCERNMPEKWLKIWNEVKPFAEFTLPEPNPFIAQDFTILCEKERSLPKYPKKIIDSDLCELWFRQDDKFLLPIGCYNFYFMSPIVPSSTENMILMILMTTLLKYQFVEKLYPATVAGLEYSVYSSDRGIVLKVSGFNEKLHLIIDVFVKCLKSLVDDTTEKQFEVFVQQQYKVYENIFIKPKVLANELRLTMLEAHHALLCEKNQKLQSIKFADFQQFCKDYTSKLRIKALMQGNLKENKALEITNNIISELKPKKLDDLSALEMKAMRVPIGVNNLRCKSFNANDVNTSITNFYQIGPISFRTHVMIDLLSMIAQEPLFDMLRSKEQLAYDVSFNLRDNYGNLAYSITVNSQESKFTVDHINERIEHFRGELISIIQNMPDDDFEEMKTSLAKIKLNEDNKLSEEVGRNWGEITSDDYEFERPEKEVECLATITKDILLQFYQSHYGENERKLSIQVIGNPLVESIGENEADLVSESSEENGSHRKLYDSLCYVDDGRENSIRNIMEFKKTLEICPFSRTNKRFV